MASSLLCAPQSCISHTDSRSLRAGLYSPTTSVTDERLGLAHIASARPLTAIFPVGSSRGSTGAHNTIMGPDDRYLYAGGVDHPYLEVAKHHDEPGRAEVRAPQRARRPTLPRSTGATAGFRSADAGATSTSAPRQRERHPDKQCRRPPSRHSVDWRLPRDRLAATRGAAPQADSRAHLRCGRL